MKTFCLLCWAVMVTTAMPALSSFTDSGLITLDNVPPVVALLSPAGGEAWYIGDSNDILWTATDLSMPTQPVSLLYSSNNGITYSPIETMLPNTGLYSWLMPSTQSYNSRVRIVVVDSFGNQKTVNSPLFSITYVPPAAPTGVGVNTSNNIDAVISWDPVTHTILPYNTPITPDGYIVLYNETPYEDEHFYYFLGRSFTTNYTHRDVVEFRAQMFYKVVAYKNYTREEEEALNSLLTMRHARPILWRDALTQIRQGGGK